MPEEKMNLRECMFCGSEVRITKTKKSIICKECGFAFTPHYSEKDIIAAWNTRRPADKLAPDEGRVFSFLCTWALKHNIDDELLGDLAYKFCTRFGSVPVVPVVVWPEEERCPMHDEDDETCSACTRVMDANAMLNACKAAFNDAVKKSPESVNQRLVEALEEIAKGYELSGRNCRNIAKEALESSKTVESKESKLREALEKIAKGEYDNAHDNKRCAKIATEALEEAKR